MNIFYEKNKERLWLIGIRAEKNKLDQSNNIQWILLSTLKVHIDISKWHVFYGSTGDIEIFIKNIPSEKIIYKVTLNFSGDGNKLHFPYYLLQMVMLANGVEGNNWEKNNDLKYSNFA